jgi:thymidylate synthase
MFTLEATTIPDSWFQLVWNLMCSEAPKTVYEIDKGSYVGQKRLEYEYVIVRIDQPGSRPLIPEIPSHLSIPAPVESMEYVNDYFVNYLMSTDVAENETYIYGTWIVPGVKRVIEQLRNSPGNNQATISIGGWAPSEIRSTIGFMSIPVKGERCDGMFVDTDNYIDPGTGQRDPACLRLIDFRLDQSGFLHMVVYFRSWDLWGGFAANLAGLQLVKEYVGQEIGAKDGCIIASSKGLHLYDHCIEVAAQRVNMKPDTMGSFLDWITRECLSKK